MSKVLLIVDIPLSIDGEDLERYEAELKIIDKYEDEYILSKHHLSLKPIPERIPLQLYKEFRDGYPSGWNDCIDDIEGVFEDE